MAYNNPCWTAGQALNLMTGFAVSDQPYFDLQFEVGIVSVASKRALQLVTIKPGSSTVNNAVMMGYGADYVMPATQFARECGYVSWDYMATGTTGVIVHTPLEVFAVWGETTLTAFAMMAEVMTDGTVEVLSENLIVNANGFQGQGTAVLRLTTDSDESIITRYLYIYSPAYADEGSDWGSFFGVEAPPPTLAGNSGPVADGGIAAALNQIANTSVDLSFNNGATHFSVLGGSRTES